MTNRVLAFIYGALSYALFFATFLYAIGFVEYANYREQVPMLVPGLGRRGRSTRALAVEAATDSGGLVQP
jgi:hypothetical protein